MTSTLDELPAFLAAAVAPAALIGLFALPLAGPFALFFFLWALFVALLHVMLLALPIHALLSLWRTPSEGAVAASSLLIGALPIPIIAGGIDAQSAGLLGMLGLSGGAAFLLVSRRMKTPGE